MRQELADRDLPVKTKHGRGFTLIELMIVVAIVAILAVVAYPAYTNSIIKGKRGQGRAALLDLMQQEERYLTQTGSYATWTDTNGPATVNGGTVSPIPFKTFSGDTPSDAAYTVYATTCPITPVPALNECVMAYAVPTFSDTDVGTLTIQSTGVKSCAVSPPNWATSPAQPTQCW
ncbi:MAG: type IV pilin protein [Proteobacteria bacterium]|nr:type IV pilin protein [Pseudomonadota bacterium]